MCSGFRGCPLLLQLLPVLSGDFCCFSALLKRGGLRRDLMLLQEEFLLRDDDLAPPRFFFSVAVTAEKTKKMRELSLVLWCDVVITNIIVSRVKDWQRRQKKGDFFFWIRQRP
jgi:hypothetical protein